MDLDRTDAYAEVVGHDLVRLAGDDAGQHVALPRRELVEPRPTLGLHRIVLFRGRGLGQRQSDRLKQDLVVEGLLDEIHHAGLHRLDGERNVAVAGHHDDRGLEAERLEAMHELQAVQARHADIGDHAGRQRPRQRIEEDFGGRMVTRGIAGGLQLEHDGMTDGVIIVDDVDDGFNRGH